MNVEENKHLVNRDTGNSNQQGILNNKTIQLNSNQLISKRNITESDQNQDFRIQLSQTNLVYVNKNKYNPVAESEESFKTLFEKKQQSEIINLNQNQEQLSKMNILPKPVNEQQNIANKYFDNSFKTIENNLINNNFNQFLSEEGKQQTRYQSPYVNQDYIETQKQAINQYEIQKDLKDQESNLYEKKNQNFSKNQFSTPISQLEQKKNMLPQQKQIELNYFQPQEQKILEQSQKSIEKHEESKKYNHYDLSKKYEDYPKPNQQTYLIISSIENIQNIKNGDQQKNMLLRQENYQQNNQNQNYYDKDMTKLNQLQNFNKNKSYFEQQTNQFNQNSEYSNLSSNQNLENKDFLNQTNLNAKLYLQDDQNKEFIYLSKQENQKNNFQEPYILQNLKNYQINKDFPLIKENQLDQKYNNTSIKLDNQFQQIGFNQDFSLRNSHQNWKPVQEQDSKKEFIFNGKINQDSKEIFQEKQKINLETKMPIKLDQQLEIKLNNQNSQNNQQQNLRENKIEQQIENSNQDLRIIDEIKKKTIKIEVIKERQSVFNENEKIPTLIKQNSSKQFQQSDYGNSFDRDSKVIDINQINQAIQSKNNFNNQEDFIKNNFKKTEQTSQQNNDFQFLRNSKENQQKLDFFQNQEISYQNNKNENFYNKYNEDYLKNNQILQNEIVIKDLNKNQETSNFRNFEEKNFFLNQDQKNNLKFEDLQNQGSRNSDQFYVKNKKDQYEIQKSFVIEQQNFKEDQKIKYIFKNQDENSNQFEDLRYQKNYDQVKNQENYENLNSQRIINELKINDFQKEQNIQINNKEFKDLQNFKNDIKNNFQVNLFQKRKFEIETTDVYNKNDLNQINSEFAENKKNREVVQDKILFDINQKQNENFFNIYKDELEIKNFDKNSKFQDYITKNSDLSVYDRKDEQQFGGIQSGLNSPYSNQMGRDEIAPNMGHESPQIIYKDRLDLDQYAKSTNSFQTINNSINNSIQQENNNFYHEQEQRSQVNSFINNLEQDIFQKSELKKKNQDRDFNYSISIHQKKLDFEEFEKQNQQIGYTQYYQNEFQPVQLEKESRQDQFLQEIDKIKNEIKNQQIQKQEEKINQNYLNQKQNQQQNINQIQLGEFNNQNFDNLEKQEKNSYQMLTNNQSIQDFQVIFQQPEIQQNKQYLEKDYYKKQNEIQNFDDYKYKQNFENSLNNQQFSSQFNKTDQFENQNKFWKPEQDNNLYEIQNYENQEVINKINNQNSDQNYKLINFEKNYQDKSENKEFNNRYERQQNFERFDLNNKSEINHQINNKSYLEQLENINQDKFEDFKFKNFENRELKQEKQTIEDIEKLQKLEIYKALLEVDGQNFSEKQIQSQQQIQKNKQNDFYGQNNKQISINDFYNNELMQKINIQNNNIKKEVILGNFQDNKQNSKKQDQETNFQGLDYNQEIKKEQFQDDFQKYYENNDQNQEQQNRNSQQERQNDQNKSYKFQQLEIKQKDFQVIQVQNEKHNQFLENKNSYLNNDLTGWQQQNFKPDDELNLGNIEIEFQLDHGNLEQYNNIDPVNDEFQQNNENQKIEFQECFCHGGDQINKIIEFRHQIGQGKFAKVFLGYHKELKKEVAIKIIDKKTIQEYNLDDLIQQEIEIQQSLDHPYILKLYGNIEDQNYVYLIQEYIDGGDLYQTIKIQPEQKFTLDDTRLFIYQLIQALIYLQKNLIIHRDIKAENILLQENEIKLADFGCAIKSVNQKEITVCGTLDYVSPEMVKRDYYGCLVDVWSLGILFYEFLTGYPPFCQYTQKELLFDQILHGEIDYQKIQDPDAKDLINKLLQRKPQDRIKLDEAQNHQFFDKIKKNYLF